METTEYDVVNNPEHYCSGGIECQDAMQAAFGTREFQIFCKINAFKYLFRGSKKNGIEDMKKARWYINRYIELEEELEEGNTD